MPSRRGSDMLALDRASVREKSKDGHLHVSLTPISKANVCGYLGREIPKWQDIGLKAEKLYQLYRDPEELEKAAASFDGKPLLLGHKPISADDHDHDRVVGAVKNPVWKPPYLMAALDVWPSKAIDAIESGAHEQLSSSYHYEADMTPGRTPDGERFDGTMRNIVANHVALVPQGRAGKDVIVHDSSPLRMKDRFPMPKTATLSRAADVARGALMAYAKPRLAQDAKIEFAPMLKGITSKNLKAKAPALAKTVGAAMKPKLATDADMDEADVQDIIEQVAEMMKDESETIAAVVAADPPEAEDAGANWADVSAFLKGKISEEDMAKLKAMFGGDDEDSAEDRKKLPVTPSAVDADKLIKDATKGMVTKAAMDEALKAAKVEQVAIREAERFVEPWAGKLPVAMDSVEAVYRAALDVLKVDHDGKHPDALADIIAVQPKPGNRGRPVRVAQDAAQGVKYDAATFPNANRLK